VLYSTCAFSSCRAAGWVYHDAGRVTACRRRHQPVGQLLVEACVLQCSIALLTEPVCLVASNSTCSLIS
jgi:hypothetical protein